MNNPAAAASKAAVIILVLSGTSTKDSRLHAREFTIHGTSTNDSLLHAREFTIQGMWPVNDSTLGGGASYSVSAFAWSVIAWIVFPIDATLFGSWNDLGFPEDEFKIGTFDVGGLKGAAGGYDIYSDALFSKSSFNLKSQK